MFGFDLNAIANLINKFLSNPIDKFKMKNASAFTIIALVLFGGVAGMNWGLEQTTTIELDGVPTVVDAIQGNARAAIEWIRTLLVAIGFALGAHTPQVQKE